MPAFAFAGEANKEEGKSLDIPTTVLEHLSDSYEWHIASYEGKSLSIPLPIIVRSSNTGEWSFCTEHSLPKNYFFDEEHHGKIYENMPDGSKVRPLDLSITKTVAQIWIVVFVMIAVFLSCARWYKGKDERSEAPGGFVGLMEMFVMTIYDDVIKASIGEKHFKPFAPYLLTVFFFIFTTNILGLLPIFPGGANVTGNINVTFFLAVCTMIAINLFGNKEYWKDIFWPHVPLLLKAPVPLMPLIELFGVFTKPFAPYLLTVFFFIFTTNILGLLPIFPGGANVTGNINVTFFLAICTMIAINLFGNKEYWKDIFWPHVPVFLKAYPVPLMPVIEFFGVFTKPFALMVRLFANMMAGHAIILSFTCVIFLGWSMGVGYGIGLNLVSAIMMLFMNCLEVLVAFIQAYVFTLLSAVFIGLAQKDEEAEA